MVRKTGSTVAAVADRRGPACINSTNSVGFSFSGCTASAAEIILPSNRNDAASRCESVSRVAIYDHTLPHSTANARYSILHSNRNDAMCRRCHI